MPRILSKETFLRKQLWKTDVKNYDDDDSPRRFFFWHGRGLSNFLAFPIRFVTICLSVVLL